MRNYSNPIARFKRNGLTNQRISFDIHSSGSHLITGSKDGKIIGYDLQSFEEVLSFEAYSSTCCNGVEFHPYLPYIVTSSGERKFPSLNSSNDSDDDEPDKREIIQNSVNIWALPWKNIQYQ